MPISIIPLEDVIAAIREPRCISASLGVDCFAVAVSMAPEVVAAARADNFDYGLVLIPIDQATGKGMPRFWEPTLH